MIKWIPSARFRAMALSIALGSMLAAPAAYADTRSNLEIQCISDQKSAAADGTISYHILYHNVSNKNMEKSWIKLKISEKLDVTELSGGNWDAVSRTIQWNMKDLKAQGAGVIHLNLKVKGTVTNGDDIAVECESSDDDSVGIKAPPVHVKVGTEIHQPAFNGYPDGGFHPNGKLTRAEAAAIMTRLGEPQSAGPGEVFSDVPANHWAYFYVQKMTQAGWMSGDGNGFHPDDPITRGELVTLLLRVRGIHELPLDNDFNDVKDHWAKNQISTAEALGFVGGVGLGKFDPSGSVNREDAAKLLALALTRGELLDGETKVTQHWPDVKRSTWSFGWVEELSLVAHEAKSQGLLKELLVRYLPEKTQSF
ncbi:S-layer homology domain-containing protein [Paenibacillus cremeus]|uniref:S-layer homology domain-containing protein n=1 Tax=Paenibacillus cremeus TaxID=2163881 RepID=A0A559KH37_9BACL|nr:S-layer homology domain-containing protein [Paenibacillus cremeus]TVY11439.1 S-layer homology domain-containing protein [Paenibacillus cremeus]